MAELKAQEIKDSEIMVDELRQLSSKAEAKIMEVEAARRAEEVRNSVQLSQTHPNSAVGNEERHVGYTATATPYRKEDVGTCRGPKKRGYQSCCGVCTSQSSCVGCAKHPTR